MTTSSNLKPYTLLSGFIVAILLSATIINAQQIPIKEFGSFKYQLEEKYAPTNAEELEKEIAQIIEIQKDITENDVRNINYWNAAYPSYRWHQIMMDISRAKKGHKNGGRVAILHLAIYDALVEVWKHKKQHQVTPPYMQDSNVKVLSRKRDYSSFICEWSAVASAAAGVIGYYFPERKSYLEDQIIQFKTARLKTGLQLPSDIENGLGIGKKIAKKYIEYAKTDRTELIWNGKVPKSDSLWTGKPNKWGPMKRQWRPLTLKRPDQFRPSPPPTDWTEDMEELRRFNATHQTSNIAWKWKSNPIWDDMLERKILEYDLDPFTAAFACAIHHTSRFDGIIAAWDGKYHYWGIRPFQYDPDFKPILVDTPNFPGYPAGHTTVAGSIARVLSFLFPQDEEHFMEMAKECSESRFEGGVHFRTDNEVGLVVGDQVGNQVISTFLEKMNQN